MQKNKMGVWEMAGRRICAGYYRRYDGKVYPHHWGYAEASGGDRGDISDRHLWRGAETVGRKRKSGEGTIRLRKDGRWEGRVVIGYDEKGLPKTKNVLAKTKGECVEKLKALKETISYRCLAKNAKCAALTRRVSRITSAAASRSINARSPHIS